MKNLFQNPDHPLKFVGLSRFEGGEGQFGEGEASFHQRQCHHGNFRGLGFPLLYPGIIKLYSLFKDPHK